MVTRSSRSPDKSDLTFLAAKIEKGGPSKAAATTATLQGTEATSTPIAQREHAAAIPYDQIL
jgi:hypothetical protein